MSKNARKVLGIVELTESFDGMPKGTRGEVFGQRVLFHPKKSLLHVPLYDWVLTLPHHFAWWSKRVKIVDGPMAELASEVLKEGEID